MANKTNLTKTCFFIVLCILLSSCFGPRLNKRNPQAGNQVVTTIASTQDNNIQIDLQFLLVKNSPRSWVKDAKWDEYVFKVLNLKGEAVKVEKITIIDSLDFESAPQMSRRKLIKATKKTKRRFKKEGIKIKLGKGSTKMLTHSLAGTVVGAGIGAGIASGGGVTMAAGTLTTAGGAVFVAVPVALVGGIVKVVNNTKVNNQLKARQTTLPNIVDGNSFNTLYVFYSAIPSPKKVIIYYSINDKKHELELVLPQSLEGLHYK